MKTAVSIPDEVFEEAEWLARRTKRLRSRLYSDALRDFLARHTPDQITEAMNIAAAECGESRDPLFRRPCVEYLSKANGSLAVS